MSALCPQTPQQAVDGSSCFSPAVPAPQNPLGQHLRQGVQHWLCSRADRELGQITSLVWTLDFPDAGLRGLGYIILQFLELHGAPEFLLRRKPHLRRLTANSLRTDRVLLTLGKALPYSGPSHLEDGDATNACLKESLGGGLMDTCGTLVGGH